jgi:hypothetical protein
MVSIATHTVTWRASSLWLACAALAMAGCAAGTIDPAAGTIGGADGKGDGAATGEDPTCEPVTFRSALERAPVDLVIAVDASGSMGDEAARVQDNLNRFSESVDAAGADLRVVLITRASFVSVPPPLGTDAGRFRFIEAPVESNDALTYLLGHFEDYNDFLRPNATTHFLVVTDDESFFSPSCFLSMMTERLGHPFHYHAIAAENASMAPAEQSLPVVDPAACTCAPMTPIERPINGYAVYGGQMSTPGCAFQAPPGVYGNGCLGSAAAGDRHVALAQATGGLVASICATDWSSTFDALSAAVTRSALPCAVDVPDSPDGYAVDLDELRVAHTPEGGTPNAFTRATDATCGDGDWYLDSGATPARVQLCADVCAEVSSEGGALSLEWECGVPIL